MLVQIAVWFSLRKPKAGRLFLLIDFVRAWLFVGAKPDNSEFVCMEASLDVGGADYSRSEKMLSIRLKEMMTRLHASQSTALPNQKLCMERVCQLVSNQRKTMEIIIVCARLGDGVN